MELGEILEILEHHRLRGTLSDAVLEGLLLKPRYQEPTHLWKARRDYERLHNLPFGSTGDPETTGRIVKRKLGT